MALPLIAAGVSVLGNVLGGLFAGSDRKKAEALMGEAERIISAVGAGPELSKQIVLQQLKQGGLLTPEIEQALPVDSLKLVQENPEMRLEQKAALDAIKQLSRTGLGIEDQVAMRQLQKQAAQDAQARQQQIMQQMAQRGQAGAGAELAMQIAGGQSGAQQLSEEADRIAARAAAARREATSQLFQGAGQMRAADLDLARLNTEIQNRDIEFQRLNSLQRQQRNIERLNQANLFNLQRSQAVSDANIEAANRELARQMQARQQEYDNKLRYAGLQSGLKQAEAQRLMGQAAGTAQSWGNIAGGIAGGITAYGQQLSQDKLNSALRKNIIKNMSPNEAMDAYQMGFYDGGKIEGPEVVKGDHPANDVIPAMLSAGEIVIPKSHATPNKAAEFVEKVNNENQKPKKNNKKKVLTSLADLLKSLDEMDN